MSYQIGLAWDPSFSKPQTWMIGDDGSTIRARLKIGNAEEVVVDVPLRGKANKSGTLGAVHIRRLDDSTWQTESAILAPALPRLVLVLKNVPEHICVALTALTTL